MDEGKHTVGSEKDPFSGPADVFMCRLRRRDVCEKELRRGVTLSEAVERTHNNVLINISAGIVEDSYNEVSLRLSSPRSVLSSEPFALCNASSVRSLEQH